MTVEFLACDSADIDATTGVCAHPVYVAQPTMFPPLDAASGITISIGILVCWAMAYGFKVLRRPGD